MNQEFIKRLLSSLVLIPLALFFIIKGGYFFILFILICLFVSIYEWHYMSKKKDYKIPGIIFLILSFYSAYYFRNEFNTDYQYFVLILFICIFTDIGGYIFGKLFKGPKLTKISPNKTYAGVIGSFLFSIIAGLVFIKFIEDIIFKNDDQLIVILWILFISLISQIGDLIISYFKRKAKLKDTGKILPGHGGLLDRIDGLIFVVPSIYLLHLVN